MPNYAYEVTLHCLGPFMKAILLFILMLHWGGERGRLIYYTHTIEQKPCGVHLYVILFVSLRYILLINAICSRGNRD